jgi:peptidoglycan/LPS O-acetylase OafA/YrhL
VTDGGGSVRHLAVVNGLRGWAILAVIHHHFFAAVFTPIGFTSQEIRGRLVSPYALASNGWLGVNLFFLLSGFVLMLPYAEGARSMTSWADARSYYARRARRLLPLYYLVILLVLYMRPDSKLSSAAFRHDALEFLTITFTFDERLFFTWYNPVLWSLAVEVWFSVIFPALVVAWKRFGMVALLVVTLPLCFAVRFYATSRYLHAPSGLNFVKDNLPGRLDDFVVGMALAVWSVRGSRPSALKTIVGFVVAFLFLTVCANAWDNIIRTGLSYQYGAGLNDLALVAFAALLGGLLACPSRWLALPFTAAPIQLFGMMSYSLYVWQCMGAHRKDFGPDDAPMYIALFLGLSAFTYRFVEFPQKTFAALFLSYPKFSSPGAPKITGAPN